MACVSPLGFTPFALRVYSVDCPGLTHLTPFAPPTRPRTPLSMLDHVLGGEASYTWREGGGRAPYRGTSPIRDRPPPQGRHRVLSIFLL
jgi:hypothetical protein